MSSQYLSEKERAVGRREMLLYEIYNGISIGLLGETLVYVLAVRFKASNLILGFIPTAIYVTSLIVPFFSKFLEGRNLGRTLYASWMLRGLVCLSYSLMLFTSGTLRIVVLMLTFVLYMLFRAIGIISYDPIAKNLTTIHSRGRFYSTLNYGYNFVMMIAKIVASITIYFYDSVLAIVILQMVGIAGNIAASIHSGRIPCKLKYSKSSDMKILPIFKTILSNGKIRNRVFLKWIYFSVTITMSMLIPFMSIKVGLSDGLVIIFSVVISLAYIAAGYVSRFLSDTTGSRPILKICSVSVIFFTGILVWSSAEMPVLLFFLIGFFMNFFLQTAVIQSNQLVVSALPDNNAAGFNIAVNMGAGIVAIIAGIVSGWLVSLGEKLEALSELVLFNDYSFCFAFGFIVSIFGIIYTLTLREKNAKKAVELMSLKNLQAISELSAIENSMNSFYRRKHIMDLGEISSSFVYGEVHRKLASPYSREIHDLLQVIGEKKSQSYVFDCIRIARNDDNYMQITAIETLSNFTDNAAVATCLKEIFYNSKWVSAKAAAARALSGFNVEFNILDDVRKLSQNAIHIETCVDCMIAEFSMDVQKKLFLDIFSDWSIKKNMYFKQTRYSCYDALLINRNALSRLARLYEEINNINNDTQGVSADNLFNLKKDAYEVFLDDFRNIDYIDHNFDDIVSSLINLDKRIIDFSNDLLDGCCDIREIKFLMCAKGLKRFNDIDENLLIESDYIALLYFTTFVRSHFEEMQKNE